MKYAVFFHAVQNSGSSNRFWKFSVPTQNGSVTKLTCWKLRMTPRTRGYHENSAKQAMPAAMKAYAIRLSWILRLSRLLFFAARRRPTVATAIFSDPL